MSNYYKRCHAGILCNVHAVLHVATFANIELRCQVFTRHSGNLFKAYIKLLYNKAYSCIVSK